MRLNLQDTRPNRWRGGLGAILFIIATLALHTDFAAAQSVVVQTQNLVRAANLGKADFGMMIRDIDTGEDIVQMDADKPLIPASNMKLVTTASALGLLGSDFHFSTQLRLEGNTLVVRGDGDPGFGDPTILKALGMDMDGLLDRWVKAVQLTNLKKFDAILIDDRAFDRDFTHPDWPRNQLHKWYCAQVAAINFNDNCLDIYATPQPNGAAPQVLIEPKLAPILLDNTATSGKHNAFWASRKLGTNQIILRGEVRHALIEPANVTVDDPPMFFGQLLQRHLRAAGIDVTDVQRVKDDQVLADGRLLAEVQTTLPTIITRCNHDSQNLFAEALFKRMGHQITGQPGSWANGAAAVRTFLAKALGSEAANVIIADGSGMSRDNRVTPRSIVKLLTDVQQDEKFGEVFRMSLASPDEPGTLDDRFKTVQLTGRVRAKTGYLKGVIALSGYLQVADHTVVFSMIVNDYYGSTYPIKQMMEKIIAAVDADLASQQPVNLGG